MKIKIVNIVSLYIVFCYALCSSNIAVADDVSKNKHHIDDNAIDALHFFISNVKSIAVEFEQIDKSGKKIEGILIIDKPYRFRCNYYFPFPLLIVGNKNYVSIYDHEMDHLTRINAVENLFNFLLLDKLVLSDKIKIIDASTNGNKSYFKILYSDLDRVTEIALDRKSQKLDYMKIIEHDNEIMIKFNIVYDIINVDPKLFIIKDPAIFGKIERINRKDIKKHFIITNSVHNK